MLQIESESHPIGVQCLELLISTWNLLMKQVQATGRQRHLLVSNVQLQGVMAVSWTVNRVQNN